MFSPILCDPFVLVLSADHEPGDILQEEKGYLTLTAEFDKMGGLIGSM
jgi:hypothetical protein